MPRLNQLIGNILFWTLWPVLFLYLKGSSRCRVIIAKNNQILLVKNWLGPGEYSLPGGGIRKNEQPPNGVIREIEEELGITLQVKSLTRVKPAFTASDMGQSYKCYSYAINLDKPVNLIRRKLEIAEIKWVDYKQVLSSYKLSQTSKQLITTWLDHNHLVD